MSEEQPPIELEAQQPRTDSSDDEQYAAAVAGDAGETAETAEEAYVTRLRESLLQTILRYTQSHQDPYSCDSNCCHVGWR